MGSCNCYNFIVQIFLLHMYCYKNVLVHFGRNLKSFRYRLSDLLRLVLPLRRWEKSMASCVRTPNLNQQSHMEKNRKKWRVQAFIRLHTLKHIWLDIPFLATIKKRQEIALWEWRYIPHIRDVPVVCRVSLRGPCVMAKSWGWRCWKMMAPSGNRLPGQL